MAQRTEAIYNGKSIGIESIYTVIGDKQINIPEKLNWLREKSKKGELFETMYKFDMKYALAENPQSYPSLQ